MPWDNLAVRAGGRTAGRGQYQDDQARCTRADRVMRRTNSLARLAWGNPPLAPEVHAWLDVR